MATEMKLNTEEDENQPSTSAPSGLNSGVGQASPGGAAAPTRSATPSGRPNVGQYLQANQGAGQKLAGGIESNVQKQAGAFDKSLSGTRDQLGNAVNPLENKLGEGGSQKIQMAFKDPAAILQQQQQLAEFKRLQSGGYNQNIQQLQGQTATQQQQLASQQQKLAGQAANANTETGRFDLLRSSFGQPNYNRGQAKLDQLFLQAQPGVNRSLQQNLQGISSGAGDRLNQFGNEADARLNALQGLSGERVSQVSNLLKGGTDANNLESDVNSRGLDDIALSSEQQLEQAKKRAESATGIQDRLLDPSQLSPEEIRQLGLDNGALTYGTNLADYLSDVNLNPTLAGATDSNEFARYRALQQLSGDTSGDIFGGAETAGDWNPYQYNTENAKQALNDNRTLWEETKFNDLIGQYRAARGGPRGGGSFGGSASYSAALDAVANSRNNTELQQRLNEFTNSWGGGQPDSAEFAFPQLTQYLRDLQKQRGIGKIGSFDATKLNEMITPGYLPTSKYDDESRVDVPNKK